MAGTSKTVTVKSGDTLSKIAKANGTTVAKILDANPKFTEQAKFKGGNMIWAGTTVKIPGQAPSKPPVTATGPSTPTTPPATTVTSTPASSPPSPPPAPPAIKTAPIDTVTFIDETASTELMIDLLFEDVGGQELLTIARNDTVNGQDVIYQPFKNLAILQEIYNPTTLLRLQETSDKYFANFIINLRDKIPNVGSGINGANYYLDFNTGDGVIELVNLKSDEQVEVQISTAGIIDEVGI